ncbi:deleted in malignant brain tumors 1 protein-like isoform X2 [Pocillopora verrucosa]|uniref:deleted in malignant brain tumors 1 protein-like isoform X2 n=1 Tax=Pocillopora verrucosa TaxID=203993 RepID=UPI00333FB20C
MSTAMLPPASGSCLYNLYEPQGNFSTPNYPQNYGHNVHCTWLITTSPGSYIFLRFDHFHLEGSHGSCPYDYVRIYDGNSYQSLTMRRCDYQDSWCIYSQSNILYVHFQTDGSVSYPGFTAFYEKVSKRYAVCKVNSSSQSTSSATNISPSPATSMSSTASAMLPALPGSCLYNLGGQYGYFHSPNYPSNYDHQLYCVWVITVPNGYYIYLRFDHFHLEGSSGSCPYDYVQIYDGTSHQSLTIKRCDHQNSWCVYSHSNVLYVYFVTDHSVSYSGFTAYYERVHETYYVCPHPNATHHLPSSTFSGISPTPASISPMSTAMLPPASGSCLYNLYGPQGNFSTPNYPQNYGHNVHCTWLITTSPGSYIFLRFDHFHLEGSHGSCPYDYVRIYDGNTYQSLTMRRCDYQDSWCIYSQSNILYVHFQTDGSVSYPGFTAFYEKVSKRYAVCKVNSSSESTSSATNISPSPATSMSSTASAMLPALPGSCLYNLGGQYGYFHSPNYPSNYDHQLYCVWVITVPNGYYIYLRFDHFHLEGSSGSCPYDYVQIYDGTSHQSLTIKRCDHQNSWCVYSHSNVLYVYFVTDHSVSYSGFTAYYERVHETYYVCPHPNATHHLPSSTFSGISPTPASISPMSTAMLPPASGSCLYNLYGPQGNFSTPNYPQNYGHNVHCTWLITTSPGSYIFLRFDHFHLEGSHGSCPYDYVRIYDGNSYQSLTMRRCDYQDSWCIYSQSNILYVHFQTDGSVSYPGFTAFYEKVSKRYAVCKVNSSSESTSSASNISPSPATSISSTASAMLPALPGSCLYNLGGQYGYFHSPNYPSNYDHQLYCVWVITVPNGYYIYLRFDHFHLEGGFGSCPYDYVQIYDGKSYQSLTIRRCHYQNSWCVYSHSNVLYVYFVTDHSVSYSGFTAYYERVHETYYVCPHPNATHHLPSSTFSGISPTPASISPMSTAMLPPASGSCLYNLYGPQGNFSTPNYPQNYGHNVHCTWLITTSPGSYIFLRFDHFHLEGSHGSCPYDYVRIYDGNSYQSLTMRRCDYQDSWCIYSHSNVLYVHFQTDGSVSYPGFTAYYEKVSKRYTVCKVNSSISQGITPTSAAPRASASAAPSFPSECHYHSYLTEAERRMSYYNGFNGYLQCDNLLPLGWYRFGGAAGTEMPTSCVGQNRCGTHAPGWLNGSHPRATDGIVRAKVCFHWSSDCCLWSANIRVRNCSGFYVYELVPPPNCHLRYCGNGGALNPTSIAPTPSQSIAAVTPAIPGNCFHHLNQPSGSFESPGKPGCYPNNKHCAWLLEAPVGQYIELRFYSFHLEYGSSNCPWDYVEILDGNSLHSPILVKACGQLAWWRLYSSGRFLMVLFNSDGIIGMPGFSAYYRASYYRYNIPLPSQQVSITSPVQCFPTQTQTATPFTSNVHGIQPTPASAMTSTFYAASSVNVQPDPSQFQFHLPAQCEQSCHNTLGSYTCSCVSGYQLAADGKSCSDVDECLINNGGCSHHCYNIPGSYYCGCPEGTSMGANNLTCVEPGVSVNCSDIITVALEKKTFPFFDVARLHLRYSSCKATQNDTHLLISTPLNGCGTLVNETEDDLIFWNEIRTEVVLIDNVITRSHDVKIPFYCSYSRRKWVNLGFKPQHLHFGTEVGYGNFTFKIDFYKSSSFSTPYTEQDYPLSVPVNQYLYVRYSVESSADLAIMAVTCRATKTGSLYSWPQYSIILNGCPRDTTMEYNFDPQRNYQQFKIRAFRFFNDYDQVYIHCEVLACHKYSSNSRCTQSCLGSKKRKRRDVTRDETEHEESTTKVTLTRGPLIIQQDEEPGETGQNKQTALIGGVAGAGGFALVAVAALAVLFVKYRIARRFINRNKVGDLYTTQDEQLSRRNAYVQPEDMVEQEDSF